ncbi:MAG TPA: cupredoxin domain-containing protein [Acidimicrobiia bacterium]|nr:cupredoxin domain-containing protein [Acidimicrobiia bacterium]
MRRLLLLVVVGLMLGACGGDTTTTTVVGSAAGPTLTIQGRSFGQAPEVGAGETFAVVNQDPVRHTITSPDDLWEEVSVAGGASAEFTVPAALDPGTYDFVCAVHPDMGGRLTVSG